MAIRCGLAVAAVMLAVSTSSVRACDDVHEEMALAAAREAVKAARIAAQQQPADTRWPGRGDERGFCAVAVRASTGGGGADEPLGPIGDGS